MSPRRTLFALCAMVSLSLNAQVYLNLVNNPSFEDTIPCPIWQYGLDTIGCPRTTIEMCKAMHWFNPFIVSCGSTSDYYHACNNNPQYAYPFPAGYVGVPKNHAGYQWARTGNAYVGIGTFYYNSSNPYNQWDLSEYVGNRLKDTLAGGKQYCVTFYVSLANNTHVANNKLGAYLYSGDSLFVTTIPNCTLVIDVIYTVTPAFEENNIIADTLNWVPIQGVYQAKGGERYLSIGRFTPRSNVNFICAYPPCIGDYGQYAYYYIDDVSVIEINPAKASSQGNYTICPGESVILGGDTTEDAQYVWYPPTALSCTSCAHPRASPTITTTYYVQKTQCKITTQDSVRVVVRDANYFSLSANAQMCTGDTFYLVLPKDTALHYNWSPLDYISCISCDSVAFYPPTSSTYVLETRYCQQRKYDTLRIKLTECNSYTVPNIFTPNGDGVNDGWGIQFKYPFLVKEFHLEIYDRWGVKMFESDKPNAAWDGRTISGETVPTGTYFYTAEFLLNNKKEKLKGYITLMR